MSESTESTEVNPRPQNTKELADLIESLTVFDYADGGDGYSKAADALWQSAQAAFDYVADKLGVTGFQASWAALRFYGQEMRIEGPFMVIQAADALYPQYDVPASVAKFLDDAKPWLRERAAEKLESGPSASASVVAHWRALVAESASES